MSNIQKDDFKNHIYCCSEIGALYHEVAVKYGLSDSAMNILYTIYEQGEGCTQSDVYRLSGISRQTINSAIKKMEREEWIYLKPGKAKQMHIFLTKQGMQMMKEKLMPLIHAEHKALERMMEPEQAELFRLTQKFMEYFREEIRAL